MEEEVRIGINVRKGLERLFIPGRYAKEIRDEESLKEFPELRNILIVGGYLAPIAGYGFLIAIVSSLYQNLN